MANVFQTQTKLNKALAFQWAVHEGFADHCKNGNSELPNAVDRTGNTVYLRRPGVHKSTASDLGANYDLPSVMNPLATYGVMQDVIVPFTIAKRFSTPLQLSVEDLLTKTEMSDAMESHIKPAISNLRNDINNYIAGFIETAAGNALQTDGTGDGYLQALYNARSIMKQRAGINPDDDKSVLFAPQVMPKLGLRGPNIFHGVGQEKMFSKGEYDGSGLAGFNVFESPLIHSPTFVDIGTSAVVAAGYAVANRDSAVWTQTWSVDLTGVTASITIAKGTKIKFTNGSTDITWRVANTSDTIDTGYVATFTVVADAVVTSGGAVTLTLSEPFISGGDFQNVTASLVAGSTKVSLATDAGKQRPSFAFAKDAIVIGSPKVIIPKSVDFGENLSLGGFNIALIEDHALSMQRVTQLVAFIAVAVPRPEGIVAIYD